MQFIDQLVNSDHRLGFCQERGVVPLLSYALFRHFYPNVDTNRPLIKLDYMTLYASSAGEEPRTLEALFVAALRHLKTDRKNKKRAADYVRIEMTADSYKARFRCGDEWYVFHLLEHTAGWQMTLCYASDD